MSDNPDKKEINVVNGDGTDLNISPVYEHIKPAKPKGNDKNPKDIIIPGEKKMIKKEEPKENDEEN